jgi:hypothetical protein
MTSNIEKRKDEIQKYFSRYHSYFPLVAWDDITEYMQNINDNDFDLFLTFSFKDPFKMFWTAFPLGIFGIDRFLLGDTGLGILKLLTLGQFFIGFTIDCFTIIDRTKNFNYNKFLQIKTGFNLL